MVRALIVFLFGFITTSVFAQWQMIHPRTPLHRYLSHAIIPKNSNACLALGNVAGVSSDEGISWQRIEGSHLPREITAVTYYHDIFFTTETTGFFVYQNAIYKTTDKAVHWKKVLELQQTHPNYQASAFLQSVFFRDELNGYAVGEFEKMLITKDGGENWEVVMQSASTAPYRSFSDVLFLNASVGFISGYEVSNISMNFGFREFVLRTIDGGITWEEIEIPSDLENRALRMQFTDALHGFIHLTRSQYGDTLFATSNGGESWHEMSIGNLRNVRAMYWTDDQTGLLYGRDHEYRSLFLRTTDAGAHWTEVVVPLFSGQDEYAIQGFAFTDKQNGYTVGSGGMILHTADGGQTWQQANTGYPAFYTFDFIDKDHGYASSGRGFFRTADGGMSWQYEPRSDSLIMLDMKFNTGHNGIFFGFRNNYHRVRDGATSIDRIDLPVSFLSLSECVMEGDSLFVAGRTIAPNGNVFLKSGDWGKTWITTYLPDTQNLLISLNKTNHVFYAATSHTILQSRGGNQWTIVYDFLDSVIETALFLTDSTGLVVVGKDLKRTTDGGKTWATTHSFGIQETPTGFLKASADVIFAFGFKQVSGNTRGAIWKSVNRGASWIEENLPPFACEIVTDMRVVDDVVMAAGGSGQVLRAPLDMVTGIEGQPRTGISVFPVPASMEIHFRSDQHVRSVSVVDIHGRRFQQPWSKTEDRYTVDIQNLPAGVYLIRITGHEGTYQSRFVKND